MSIPTYTFRAKLWEYPGEAAWFFVSVPSDYYQEIKDISGPRRGFGSVRVEATIGEDTWRTSIFPDTKEGTYLLPVKKSIRSNNNLSDGSKTSVNLRLVDLG